MGGWGGGVGGVVEEDALKCECMQTGGRESLKCEHSHIIFFTWASTP